MQISDLNSKPHGVKSIKNIIDRAIDFQLYPSPGSLHYQQIRLGIFVIQITYIVSKIRKLR